jgi:hypothetical protein
MGAQVLAAPNATYQAAKRAVWLSIWLFALKAKRLT